MRAPPGCLGTLRRRRRRGELSTSGGSCSSSAGPGASGPQAHQVVTSYTLSRTTTQQSSGPLCCDTWAKVNCASPPTTKAASAGGADAAAPAPGARRLARRRRGAAPSGGMADGRNLNDDVLCRVPGRKVQFLLHSLTYGSFWAWACCLARSTCEATGWQPKAQVPCHLWAVFVSRHPALINRFMHAACLYETGSARVENCGD